MNQSVDLVGLDRFESKDARETRAALGFSDPEVTLTDPAEVVYENYTPENAEKLKTRFSSVTPLSNEAELLRKSLAAYYTGANRTLADFGADATEESIKSYLDHSLIK
jgi:hypothetical protein